MNGVIYARYSSESQREESIEGQLRECNAFAEKHGINIIGTYIDRAFSAKTDRRPDFQRMIKDSSKKAFEMIIVPRIGRTLAVNENTFSCFSIENEECIGHAILFYMKVSFVLGNEIIVIEQVL